jgi:hypothetical protein
MNDLKNFLLAYTSTISSVFAAIETRTLITIVSAIVLPIIFFAIGKTVDVILQIHLEKRRLNRKNVNERQQDVGLGGVAPGDRGRLDVGLAASAAYLPETANDHRRRNKTVDDLHAAPSLEI